MNYNKLIYTLPALALFVASCSQDEPGNSPVIEKGRIEFRASLPEVSSRSTEVTPDNLEEFTVSCFIDGSSTGTAYFHGKTFSRNAATGSYFSRDPECIWPNNNSEVHFMAFAPGCEAMRLAGDFADTECVLVPVEKDQPVSFADYKIENLTISGNILSQFDFVTAQGSGHLLANEDTPVEVEFKHQLSRIELNAWGASSSFSLEIAGARLGGVGTCGTYRFASPDEATLPGVWEDVTTGCVEYIFGEGDQILNIANLAGADKAVSILTSEVAAGKTYDTSAMLIPGQYSAWDYKADAPNGDTHYAGLYLSVLMRITDTTPYAAADPVVYPYADNDEGMEVIYFAVNKETGAIAARLYRDGEGYFSDASLSNVYEPVDNEVIKAFGWAAFPLGGEDGINWQPGYVYTYTLNYTGGVGLRDPRDPQPGKPIISDRVLIDVKMTPWQSGGNSDVTVPRR